MSSKESKHRMIYNDLYKKIQTGVYKKGDQLPTEFMLVEEYGISRPTVAKALNDLQEEGFIERKVGAGTFVKNTPQGEEDRYLALLVPDIGRNQILEPLYSQIARSCEEEDYTLIWSGSLIGTPQERIHQSFEFCRKYIKQNVAGIFLYPASDIPTETYEEMISLFDNAGIPVQIIYQSLYNFSRTTPYDFCGMDSYAMGYRVGRSLINNGSTHPALCWEEESPLINTLLIKGFEEAARESSLQVSTYQMGLNDNLEEKTDKITGSSTDALFCTSDSLAADFMTELLDREISIPGTIQIAGLGNTRFAKHLKVSLSSLAINMEEIGRMAVDLMRLRLRKPASSPRKMLIDGQFIERESTLC
ncbi:GntR family transcriptional regulator [Oceanispirochaeta sp.]|uniref:GntR family transcriptional regulator n=1 Tax=Oceanispirochaeta sp. TaxID=2035350 RepID=UPI0026362A09|nr:GntR family transcriptional regulator [Oceanispirochaeta sp.]MDA3958257.1 GntR family transcriptional regulator [Oceanispirochaeta sp.]